MAVTWLHVSDFHIRTGDPYDRNVVLKALVASVRRMRENGRVPDLIFATGDIAFSGKPAEYKLATKFFDELLDAANVDRDHLFIIPGNHDVDRTLGVGLARTLTTREEADAYFGPNVPKAHIKQKLGAFVKWHNNYFRGIRSTPTDTTCGPVLEVPVNGIRIGLLPLNSALFCLDDDDHAKLLIGRRALEPALEQLRALKADLNIALIHHPLDWLSDVDESNIRASLQANVDVLLRGHLHKSDIESTVSASGGYLHVAAGAAYQTRKWPNRALYGTFDGTSVTIFPIRYEDQPREVWVVDPSVFPDDAAAGHVHTFSIPRIPSTPTVPAAPAPPPTTAPAATPQFRSNIPSRYNLPFVGRDALLDEIHAVFADPSSEAVLVLHGDPGVGKSELAREYARRHHQHYPGGTILIRADGGELVNLARIGKVLLGLTFPADFSIREQGERTLLSLGSSPVLLIYDNVTSDEAIGPWLPPAGMPCHVLITTVLDDWGPQWRSLRVAPLSHEISLELIRKVAGEVVAARFGEPLATLAGGLPIQICPAAATLKKEEERGHLDSVSLEMTSEARESFRVPYEILAAPERLLLHAAAFLNTQQIIRDELLRQLHDALGWSEADVQERLDACLDLHLLEGGEELRMHQLFASFLRESSLAAENSPELAEVQRVQKERLLHLADDVVKNPANSELAVRMTGFCLDPEGWKGDHLAFSFDENRRVGQALVEIGKFREARPWFERAVRLAEQGDVQGRVDHTNLGSALHDIGDCLWGVERYDEARSLYERAAAELRQGDVHGRVNHASLGMSLHQVGICLFNVRRFEDARPWFERAVAAKRKGDEQQRIDHESLSKSLHSIGSCLLAAGEYEASRTWFERAVEAGEKGDVHGRVDHDSMGRTLTQIATRLERAGKYEDARSWYERAVEAKTRGDIHGRIDQMSLGNSLHGVGSCLASLGKHGEARPWYERAVEAKRKGDLFGRTDRGSLRVTLAAGAECLRALGRMDEAKEWADEAAKLEAEEAAGVGEPG